MTCPVPDGRCALEDDSLVPEPLRVAWRLLRNAGYIPPELVLRREVADARERSWRAAGEGAERTRLDRRLRLLQLRLAEKPRQRHRRRLPNTVTASA